MDILKRKRPSHHFCFVFFFSVTISKQQQQKNYNNNATQGGEETSKPYATGISVVTLSTLLYAQKGGDASRPFAKWTVNNLFSYITS